MEYEDRITISAPEGIAVDYTLAGLGSRFLADLVDIAIRVIGLAAVLALLTLVGASDNIRLITFLIGGFFVLFGYDIAFEVWGAGRTPGKRWNGLRVLMADGRPVTFGPSAVRNLMRVIDIWATAMIAGSVSIIATKHNQRLGDLAGGTIVVRERRAGTVRFGAPAARTTTAAPAAPAAEGAASVPGGTARIAGVDVTAITASELSAIRDFLSRRDRLSADARTRVARTLAETLAAKVGGLPPGGLPPEQMLETIAVAKASSGYGSASTP